MVDLEVHLQSPCHHSWVCLECILHLLHQAVLPEVSPWQVLDEHASSHHLPSQVMHHLQCCPSPHEGPTRRSDDD